MLAAIPDLVEPDLGSPHRAHDSDEARHDRWPKQVKHYTKPTHSVAVNLNVAVSIYATQMPARPGTQILGNATERHANQPGTTQRARFNTIRSLSTDSANELQRTTARLTGLAEAALADRSDLSLSRRPRTSTTTRPASAGGEYGLEAMLKRPMSAVRPMPRPSTASRRGLADPLALFGYETLGPIAAGAFSQVVRARQVDSGGGVAVKSWTRTKLARAPHHVAAMKAEVGVLRLLQQSQHPNIANMVELLESRSVIFLVLEYCSGTPARLRKRAPPSLVAEGWGKEAAMAPSAPMAPTAPTAPTARLSHSDQRCRCGCFPASRLAPHAERLLSPGKQRGKRVLLPRLPSQAARCTGICRPKPIRTCKRGAGCPSLSRRRSPRSWLRGSRTCTASEWHTATLSLRT